MKQFSIQPPLFPLHVSFFVIHVLLKMMSVAGLVYWTVLYMLSPQPCFPTFILFCTVRVFWGQSCFSMWISSVYS